MISFEMIQEILFLIGNCRIPWDKGPILIFTHISLSRLLFLPVQANFTIKIRNTQDYQAIFTYAMDKDH